MNGEVIKRKLAASGHNIAEVAKLLGMSRQNLSQSLSSQDVKTGLVEKISTAIGMPVSYFFSEDNASNVVASGDYSAASVHGDATVSTSTDVEVLQERIKSLQELVNEKERTIKILMNK